MLDIEKAKKQAGTLTDYLRTVGKNLKRTHALEAVARMNGHKSWNTFLSEAQGDSPETYAKLTGQDLAALFARGEVDHVVLDSSRYQVCYYNSEALGAFEEIFADNDRDFTRGSTCVELERNEHGLFSEHALTVNDISEAKHQDGKWILPDGAVMVVFVAKAVSC